MGWSDEKRLEQIAEMRARILDHIQHVESLDTLGTILAVSHAIGDACVTRLIQLNHAAIKAAWEEAHGEE